MLFRIQSFVVSLACLGFAIHVFLDSREQRRHLEEVRTWPRAQAEVKLAHCFAYQGEPGATHALQLVYVLPMAGKRLERRDYHYRSDRLPTFPDLASCEAARDRHPVGAPLEVAHDPVLVAQGGPEVVHDGRVNDTYVVPPEVPSPWREAHVIGFAALLGLVGLASTLGSGAEG